MPTWGEIMEQRTALLAQGQQADRILLNQFLAGLSAKTDRDTILYATRWTQPLMQGVSPDLLSITEEDLQGMMEVIHGLKRPKLDLILHSPGGSAAAAEAIVLYLRSKFKNVRVIVPQAAMSAATMLACSADEIVLGKHSFLGPIDPQFVLNTPLGQRAVPADAVREQFDQAIEECQNPKKAVAWFPMLAQYGPDILVQCENTSALSKELVKNWLKTYMFKDDPKKASKSSSIARWLADHKRFKTHSRHISRDELAGHGLKIIPLEKDQDVQDLVLSVFHTVTQFFDSGGVIKLLANNIGKAFAKGVQLAQIPAPQIVRQQSKPAAPKPATPTTPAPQPGSPQSQPPTT